MSGNTRPPITVSPSPAPQNSGRRDTIPAPTTSPHTMPASRSIGCSGNAIAKYSNSPLAVTATMNPANSGAGSFQTISQMAGIATAAVRSLVLSMDETPYSTAVGAGRGFAAPERRGPGPSEERSARSARAPHGAPESNSPHAAVAPAPPERASGRSDAGAADRKPAPGGTRARGNPARACR